MDYIEIERTLDVLKAAIIAAKASDNVDGDLATGLHKNAVWTIHTEFKRLRELLDN